MRYLLTIFVCLLQTFFSFAQNETGQGGTMRSFSGASFLAPDTVCVNTPVAINNTSIGAADYYWNFCVANSSTNPEGTNLGNFGFSQAVFVDYAKDGDRWYAFVTNNTPGRLVRLDFGNSLLNTPTAHDFGNLGGVIPELCEGIQLVRNEGKWYAIIVGGHPVGRIVKVDFGSSLSNNNPVATNWGNVGDIAYPVDLHLFQQGSTWYGLTINAHTSTITRFNFTNSFENKPTGTNLGNIGGLNYPTGIYAISKDNQWYAFVTNAGHGEGNSTNASLTRLDFGNSLLNSPTGVNLGNPGNTLRSARDLTIYQSCNEIFGFVVNYSSENDIVRLNFNNTLTSVPTAVSIGNIGNLSFPHCISKVFRVENDLYSFVANVNNNTITRLKFSGCNGNSVASSAAKDPPPLTYSVPGVYNINLTVNDGLPTQTSACRQVVVLAPSAIRASEDITICPGEAVQLKATGTAIRKYRWSPVKGLSDTTVADPVARPDVTTRYVVTVTNAAGCVSQDTVVVTVRTQQQCTPVIPLFTMKDTVCINTPVTITNMSSGASAYYWNFCTADISTPPTGINFGNLNGTFQSPVYIDYVFEGGKYYGFQTNNVPGGLVRLDFGNSLLNVPTAHHLGSIGGVIPPNAEGVQVVQNAGRWYVIIVGGDPAGGNPSRIVKVELGTDIANNAPVAVDWGNIGNMNYPHDLYVFEDGSRWYGLTVNTGNHTITRFDFGVSFAEMPTAVNLGNIGAMVSPTGVHAFKENGLWHAFVTNAGGNSLTRLDFGLSLLNTPTGVNLGNIDNNFHTPWDIYVMKYCGQRIAFLINATSNDLVKLDFGSDIKSKPKSVSYGNIGNLSFPHCLSKIFRVGADLFTLIPNVNNNSLTRLQFAGCTAADIPSSVLQHPPAVTYTRPGIYNVNLSVDDSLPTQAAYCRQIVVLESVHTPLQTKTFCAGDSVLLMSSSGTGNFWNTGNTTNRIYAKTAGNYWVQSMNSAGCINIDSFRVEIKPNPIVNLGADVSFCTNDSVVLDAGNLGAAYLWQNGNTNQQLTVFTAGVYHVAVTKDGCTKSDTVTISTRALPVVAITGDTSICKEGNSVLTAVGGTTYHWSPSQGLSSPSAAVTTASPQATTTYAVTVTNENGCAATGTVTINVAPKPVFSLASSKAVLCLGDTALLTASGGDRYTWSPAASVSSSTSNVTKAFPLTSTVYSVTIEHLECELKETLSVRLPVVTKPKVQTTKSNDINCFLGQAQLQTGGGNQYRWQPAAGLSDPLSSRPIVTTNTTTTYHVQITTAEGCRVEDSITIYVAKGDDGSGFPVPSAFTPNGDGKNDCFGVKSWGEVQDFSMNIYNRWGEVLFQTSDPLQCWNGIFKGTLQPVDTYVYWIKAKTRCGDIFRKGSFALIR